MEQNSWEKVREKRAMLGYWGGGVHQGEAFHYNSLERDATAYTVSLLRVKKTVPASASVSLAPSISN